MRYRRDIDGLRALAVIPVVLYHARLGPFTGGFIGVDVFFVISGYLITSLITEEMRQDKFSIIKFYERRVRQILPALFLVILCTCAAAAWLMMPGQFDNFGKSVASTSIFSSNILFWRQAGYFAAPAADKPLLHTWSLAVEEQFYIAFPLLLFVIRRWLKGGWVVWLVPAAMISFAVCLWGTTHKPEATFYLAPTRAWELLVGSLLALETVPELGHRLWRELAGLVGLGLVAWGVVTFTPQTSFPGANGLFPVGGAALIIYSGGGGETIVSRLLSTKVLVAIGLISYSLYLWHWPLIVFVSSWNIFELSSIQMGAVVAASFVLAALSWKFVELPFRRKGGVFQPPYLFGSAAGVMLCFAGFGLAVHFSNGLPHRLPALAAQLAATSSAEDDPLRDKCVAGYRQLIAAEYAVANCVYGADVEPHYAVWGDSHAEALIGMLGRLARKHGEAAVFFGKPGCPPVYGVEARGVPECAPHNTDVFKELVANKKLRTVVLVSRWSAFLRGWSWDLGPVDNAGQAPLLTDSSKSNLDLDKRRALFSAAMKETVDGLTAAGKRIVLVYPIPETGYDVPKVLARIVLEGGDPGSFTRPAEYYRRRNAFVFRTLESLGSPDKVVRVYPNRRFCGEEECIVYKDGQALYRDDDHLKSFGGELCFRHV